MFEAFSYPNGLKAVVSKQLGTKAVTVLVMVKVGSRFENKNLNGIAHFTEHLMFKGTKRRPSTFKISRELDSIGADYNAFTSKEFTGYYIKTDSKHLSLALDMLADMLQNSKLDSKEITREKGVIIEEINMYEDAPMMLLDDIFDLAAYPGSQLGRNVAGSKKTVNSFTRVDFVNFIKKYYVANNMLVAVSGNIEISSTQEIIQKFFKNLKIAKIKPPRAYHLSQSKPRVYIKHKQTEQIHLALGYVSNINHKSKALLPLKVANVVFGGNMSSRLFINIREREGLCYYIRSRLNTYIDVSNFTVFAGLDKSRINSAVKLILKEFNKLKTLGISKDEFFKAKEYIRGKTVLALEDSANIAQWYADRWLNNESLETPERYLQRMDALKITEVQAALRIVMKPAFLNLAVIGQDIEEQSLLHIIS
jgi:predicted Zn-dependent peptidase